MSGIECLEFKNEGRALWLKQTLTPMNTEVLSLLLFSCGADRQKGEVLCSDSVNQKKNVRKAD